MSAADKFLLTQKPETSNPYSYGLREFAEFYQPEGTVEQFIDRVQIDLQKTDWKEKQFIAQDVLKRFSQTLQTKGLAPKSVRLYVSSVQSMLRHYLGIKVSLYPGSLPASITLSKPYPWTLETITPFIDSMKDPMYQSLSSLFFQSALAIEEATSLTYQDIKEEYENNICPLCLDFGIKTRKKTQYPFLTFIGSWALEKLKAYLKDKKLSPELRLYPVDKEKVDTYFREIAKPFLGKWEGRCPMRPQSLRTAFKTLCTDAKVIDKLYVEFYMGHGKPGKNVEETYISKTKEAWRTEYKKLEAFLTPTTRALATIQN